MTPDEKLKKLRETCLANAEALLSTAERELNHRVDHACFHLALLALEEIGKEILATVLATVSLAGREKNGLVVNMGDHEKKIFWALWGGFMRGDKISKEEIEKYRAISAGLHTDRLFYLYTDPNNPSLAEEKMEEGEAQRLVELVRARLEIEKHIELKDIDEKDVENLTWFFSAIEDPEKAKYIFGGVSIAKMIELKGSKQWIEWLREGFEKHEESMRELGLKELKRERPKNEKDWKPKYKMRVRLQSPSHSIKGNAFLKWNDGVNDIKLYKSDRKNVSEVTKSEFIAELTFQNAIPVGALWEHGFFMSKTLAIAFCVGTRGVFWWNVPKDLEKYYEEITDVEADPNGSVKLKIVAGKRLAINWDEVHFSLTQEEVVQALVVFGYLLNNGKKLEESLKSYATALAILSKIDIHLRMEANAFDLFWKALKDALRSYGDWDGNGDIKEAVEEQYKKLGEMKDLERTLDLAIALDLDVKKEKIHPITLTEVVAMKIYFDHYMHLKISEEMQALSAEIKDGPVA